jgi:hypothetical protein
MQQTDGRSGATKLISSRIDRAGVGGALSPVRLDVLLTFRAHDQRWAWRIPR